MPVGRPPRHDLHARARREAAAAQARGHDPEAGQHPPQAEDADPADPFTHGLRQRYNELNTERQALLDVIADLDRQDGQEPDRPSAGQLGPLDALPHLAINLDRAPSELLDRLFGLTQLTIRVHYATDEATLQVTSPGELASAVTEIDRTIEE